MNFVAPVSKYNYFWSSLEWSNLLIFSSTLLFKYILVTSSLIYVKASIINSNLLLLQLVVCNSIYSIITNWIVYWIRYALLGQIQTLILNLLSLSNLFCIRSILIKMYISIMISLFRNCNKSSRIPYFIPTPVNHPLFRKIHELSEASRLLDWYLWD